MISYIPLLVHVLKVSAELRAAGVAFGVGKVFPELFVEELVDRCIAVDSSPRVAVPVPDATACGTLLVDLDAEALFAKSRLVKAAPRGAVKTHTCSRA